MATNEVFDHPVLKEIQNLGLPDEAQSLTAFIVYMDLSEDKGWWNVECHACKELSLVFLSGHSSRNKPREIVVPLPVDRSLSPADMHKYSTMKWLPDYDTHGCILAVVAGDSSTVYYKITDGHVQPDPPDVTEWKKYRREETPQLKRHHVSEQTFDYIRNLQEQQQQQQQ